MAWHHPPSLHRFERELAFTAQQAKSAAAATSAVTGVKEGAPKAQTSATFDAFMRMAAGKEVRHQALRKPKCAGHLPTPSCASSPAGWGGGCRSRRRSSPHVCTLGPGLIVPFPPPLSAHVTTSRGARSVTRSTTRTGRPGTSTRRKTRTRSTWRGPPSRRWRSEPWTILPESVGGRVTFLCVCSPATPFPAPALL